MNAGFDLAGNFGGGLAALGAAFLFGFQCP